MKALALNNGLVDIELKHFRYDPGAPSADRLKYQVGARLREGVWECPNLPFPVNELSADVSLKTGPVDQTRPGIQRPDDPSAGEQSGFVTRRSRRWIWKST